MTRPPSASDSPSPVSDGPPGEPPSLRLRLLFGITLALVTHGSLYPWHFVAPVDVGAALRGMFEWHAEVSVGDAIGNVVLFVPLGILCVLMTRRHPSAARRFLAIVAAIAASLAFAVVLQVLQIWLPPRDAEISDAAWNALGIAIGVAIGFAFEALLTEAPRGVQRRDAAAALVLVGLWLAIEAWPLVPTLDLQQAKDALKPLLLHPRWDARSAAEVAASVVVLAGALRAARRSLGWVLACVAVAAAAKLAIVQATLSLPHAVGFVLGALAAWVLAEQPVRFVLRVALVVALVWLTFDELRPFRFAASPTPFHLMPFAAMLEGSMTANGLALLRDLFWIGAVLVPATALGVRPLASGVALALWLLALEIAQRWLPGRQPDITMALLALIWGLVLPASSARPALRRAAIPVGAHP